ncbi:Zinc finger BED domain-containing protein 1 [Merluccius polli]|uniref:Zinc finger BED domain-containing protein 1 n=1 Tax=Merluccius polli TaxID=89951 RepID=A0AA47M096_MERPO|nr:Zinc finger BED domain-containing protein 1 [Merluccius polli]
MAESISPAPAAFRAEVWKYFGFHKGASGDIDRNLVVCRLCMAKVKYSGNTTNLRAHLARHHTEIQLALPEQQAKRDPSQLTLAQVQTQKLPATSTRATKITQSVVYFICKDMRPYSVVENEGFRSMVQTLEPRYVIPSRQYITDIAVPNLYKEVKTNVLECLGWLDMRRLDAWTSRATESYVTITVHHITDEWKLESCVLQTRAMYDSHTGENIAALLKEAVAEWQLDTKDPVLVTDNAANMHVGG